MLPAITAQPVRTLFQAWTYYTECPFRVVKYPYGY
jgi:hypothetical protein